MSLSFRPFFVIWDSEKGTFGALIVLFFLGAPALLQILVLQERKALSKQMCTQKKALSGRESAFLYGFIRF